MNYLVYDLEIIKAIPNPKEARMDGIDYCGGWTDHEGMGISVIGYQWNNEEPRHCLSTAGFLDLLIELEYEDYVLCGFNSRGFDDKLLAAHDLEGVETHYDILEEVRVAAGHKRHWGSVPKGWSYKLDAIAKANGMAKTGTGELAPIMWQRGQKQEVIDYCLNDVRVTTAILELGLAGELTDPNTGKKLRLAPLEESWKGGKV
jgi:hypothetical protein